LSETDETAISFLPATRLPCGRESFTSRFTPRKWTASVGTICRMSNVFPHTSKRPAIGLFIMKYWQRITERFFHPHGETIAHFIWRSLQLVSKEGVSVIIFFVAAKLLDPFTFGIYNYVLAAVLFLAVFGDFGISVSASKYIAEFDVTAPERTGLVLANAGVMIIALTCVITLITLFLGETVFKENYVSVLYALPLVFLIPATSLYDGIYRGLRRFPSLAKISLVAGLFALGLVYPLVRLFGLSGALLAQNLYYSLLLLGLAWSYRDFHLRFAKSVLRNIASYASIIGIIYISFFLYTRVDILVLGAFGHIVEINYYEIANKFIMIITFPFLAFAQIKAPRIVACYHTQTREALLGTFRRYLRHAFVTACLLSAGMAIVIPLALRWVLPAYNTIAVLVIAYLFLVIYLFDVVANFTGNTFIISTGHAKINMVNLVVFGIANVVFDILFVYLFGFMGVAYAKLPVTILGSLSLIYFYWRAISRMPLGKVIETSFPPNKQHIEQCHHLP
jgi:O-antigen/teichoic acid export membrane protein